MSCADVARTTAPSPSCEWRPSAIFANWPPSSRRAGNHAVRQRDQRLGHCRAGRRRRPVQRARGARHPGERRPPGAHRRRRRGRPVEDREQSSAGLAEKVAHWATQLGSAIQLQDDQLTLLYKAALLHDVGTLSVPVDVLSKGGRLDPAEFSQVKRHPVVGEQILGALPRSDQLLPAVRHHHERVDGAGYPDGLGGDDIPMFARIIAIADAFVAMTSDRPYRGRLSRAEAVGILRQGAGKQWDAALVERFLPLIEKTDVEGAPEARTAG